MIRGVLVVERLPRYQPIDELLELPRVRVLRAITRFGWVSAEELKDVLGVQYEENVSNAYSAHIVRLARTGFLDRRVLPWNVSGSSCEYRINARGLAHLAEIFERSNPEREFGVMDDIEAAGGTPVWRRQMRARLIERNRQRGRRAA